MSPTRDKSKRPAPAASPDAAEPVPLVLTLRDVQAPAPPAPAAPEPEHQGLVMSDREQRPQPWLGDPEVERAEQRAARRAQVRRDRQRDATANPDTSATDMLVLSATPEAKSELCALLHAFGFGVQSMPALPDLPAPWPFAAVFVDQALTLGGDDAIEICNHVRERARLPGERKPLLVLLAEQLSPTDRVRAGLAGCNDILVGTLTRGGVAGTLEARGIRLPSDARRT